MIGSDETVVAADKDRARLIELASKLVAVRLRSLFIINSFLYNKQNWYETFKVWQTLKVFVKSRKFPKKTLPYIYSFSDK
ncbi:MAG: hypothetical protein DRR19_22970 [Candidatus Parabeggiatoa sp. nov. 1]|nr:MAG: hypothetical protein DRR19_22970 [Gammaproteobacteria bacterium]